MQKQPDDPQNYDRRAWANRNLKNYDAALADYTLLIEKDPNDAEHLVKRGATYTSLQQYENAIADYQAALKIKPDDYDTVQRLQYVQGMLPAKNAPPPPSATPTPTPGPGLITPLNVGHCHLGVHYHRSHPANRDARKNRRDKRQNPLGFAAFRCQLS